MAASFNSVFTVTASTSDMVPATAFKDSDTRGAGGEAAITAIVETDFMVAIEVHGITVTHTDTCRFHTTKITTTVRAATDITDRHNTTILIGEGATGAINCGRTGDPRLNDPERARSGCRN